MTTIQNVLSIAAGLLSLAGFVPYILAILRRETKPSKTTWIIWAVLDTITLVAMYYKDTINGQIIGAVIGVWIVVTLTMKYGKSEWTKLDIFCLGGATLGLLLWYAFSDPVLGIVLSMAMVFIGAIPTFVSAWHDSSQEDRPGWLLFCLSSVAATAAIPAWTWADATQPLTFLAVTVVMVYLVFIRRRTPATSVKESVPLT